MTYKAADGRSYSTQAFADKASARFNAAQERKKSKVATPIATTPVTPQPTPTSDVALPFSKETATYKELVGKGYTDQMILDAYNKMKSTKTPEQQAKLTKQETTQPAVNVNVQAPKPEKPAKVAEVKEPVKTPAQLQAEADQIRYNDDSEARLAEITNNLNNMVATNPNALKNIDAFKLAYSYDKRSDVQKKVLENRYAGYQK